MGTVALHARGPASVSNPSPPAFFALSAFVCVLSLLCSGCMVFPASKSRLPTGASGVLTGKLDLKFIQPNKTSRAEVLEKLSSLDSGCGNHQFFWGRWSTPSVDLVPIFPRDPALRPPPSQGYSLQNLLVEFDDQGVVQSSRLIHDDQLIPELSALQVKIHTPALDLSEPFIFTVNFTRWNQGILSAPYESGTIALFPDSFHFADNERGEDNFTAPRSTLARITHDHNATLNESPDIFVVILRFNLSSSVSRDLHVSLKLKELMTLLRFQPQV